MDHTPAVQPMLPPAWPDILALRPMPAIPSQARSVFLWGDTRVHWIALRTAALAVAKGRQVAILDADTAFQVMPFIAMAKACRIPDEVFLRQIYIARAFTCWQVATVVSARLGSLLATHPVGLVVLLGPLTTFFDEDVTDQEAKILFQRVLRPFTDVRPAAPKILVAQTVPGYHTPRRVFARDLLRVVDVGLRLLPAEGRWSVEVIKPRPSRPPAQTFPDHPR